MYTTDSSKLNYNGDANDYTKRALLKKIWNAKGVKAELGEPSNLWIWDGNKLAWSSKEFAREETRITVDLDQEEGRPTKPGQRGNKHTIFLRKTRKVDFFMLQKFLNGQCSWEPECIDTVNFLDHLMREWPSQASYIFTRTAAPRTRLTIETEIYANQEELLSAR